MNMYTNQYIYNYKFSHQRAFKLPNLLLFVCKKDEWCDIQKNNGNVFDFYYIMIIWNLNRMDIFLQRNQTMNKPT